MKKAKPDIGKLSWRLVTAKRYRRQKGISGLAVFGTWPRQATLDKTANLACDLLSNTLAFEEADDGGGELQLIVGTCRGLLQW